MKSSKQNEQTCCIKHSNLIFFCFFLNYDIIGLGNLLFHRFETPVLSAQVCPPPTPLSALTASSVKRSDFLDPLDDLDLVRVFNHVVRIFIVFVVDS